MRTLNILFLGGAKRNGVAKRLKNNGKKLLIEVNIFSYELSNEIPIDKEAKIIIGKKWTDPNILEDLIETINTYHISCVLPFVDGAISISSKLKRICKECFIPVSDEKIVKTMFDKIDSNKWFLENSIPVPNYYDHIELQQNLEKGPIICKPRKGSASKGIFYFNSVNDLCSSDLVLEDFLIQDIINNKEEVTVDCFITQGGKIVSIVPRIRIETLGGESVKSKTFRDEKIDIICRKIIEAGNFLGPITIQFIKDKVTNEIFVMEINPRLGGGVICSLEAGADITKFLILEFLNEEIACNNNWEENFLMIRYFCEHFKKL